jgi:hypothetical protein
MQNSQKIMLDFFFLVREQFQDSQRIPGRREQSPALLQNIREQ